MRLSTDGLIVREQNVGENDRLVVALTRHRGLITAFAQGARRLKNRNASSTGLLCYSNLTFFRGKDTYKVDEASAIEVFFSLRGDIVRLSLAQYFCELCLCLAPEGTEAEDFLRLVLNSLHFLASGGRPELLVKSVMELRLLSLSGYMPDLLACSGCGAFEGEEMYLDPAGGSLFCGRCKAMAAGRGLLPLSKGALAGLRHICYADFGKLFAFSLPEDGLRELGRITERYLLTQTDRRFKTLDFYHSLF
ncbi:MAG: DNA repair protein RecO [Clostridiales bacterium]|nr:DNA repair protein RecO [Clostridiales bacterium]